MISFSRSRRFATLATALLATALLSSAANADAPKTDDEKAFYSIGANMAQSLQSLAPIGDREFEMLIQGVRDGVGGKTLAVDAQQGNGLVRTMVQRRQAQVAAKEKEASKAFVASQAGLPGAKTSESGLVYIETKAGSGAKPTPTDTVRVHYHGTLRDGTVFDSSVDRGQPASFPLNRVIPCWTEGVAMMKVGGKSTLICPSDIAYGDKGSGKIAPGAALKFDVELLEIVKK